MRSSKLAVALFLTAASPAFAWNGTGHETVAQVAWDRLAPASRDWLAAVLEQHPRRDKDLLARMRPGDDRARILFLVAATWPDQVKSPLNPLSRAENHAEWHYCDLPYDLEGQRGPEPVLTWDRGRAINLAQAMGLLTAEFAAPATPPDRRAIDLCWIEHLVGDAHQPLHAVGMFTRDLPDGDRGGNLDVVAAAGGGRATNLHSLWDGLLGRSTNPDTIRKVADRIERGQVDAQAASDLDVAHWLREGRDLAVHEVYRDGQFRGLPRGAVGEPPPLPIGYEARARQVADERVALAGARLAALLERLVTKLPPTTRPAESRR